MTKDDIIRMAREAGLTKGQHWNKQNMTTAFMCDFANLVAAAEREACANLAGETVCDTHIPTGVKIYGSRVAQAIRASGNT